MPILTNKLQISASSPKLYPSDDPRDNFKLRQTTKNASMALKTQPWQNTGKALVFGGDFSLALLAI